jgi:hypothetical protein
MKPETERRDHSENYVGGDCIATFATPISLLLIIKYSKLQIFPLNRMRQLNAFRAWSACMYSFPAISFLAFETEAKAIMSRI